MKKILIVLALLLSLAWVSNFFGLRGAHPLVRKKVELVRAALEQDGYRVRWFTISERRNPVFNSMLANSVTNSRHLKGMAIDVLVMDIDGDGTYTHRDAQIIRRYSRRIESRYPAMKGTVGDYLSKSVARRMIHFDIGEKSRDYSR